ncbi:MULTISPECIES: cell division protein FtsW [Corynebacterium]|uniref:cell division protein FtsW n=2 Tax=Corynebacterium TaxID=1716 RepID=UPI001E572263|nr:MULTISPECIES: cell division protein FtsW [Corynebacterium]MCT1408798.1 cell division protein FtsW [Corynebacterium accolens]MDK8680663.1 cell division protein FtsW [Corynebacterium accolens]
MLLPLMVIAEFYVSQVTGWRGVSSSNVEGVSWSEVSSDGIVLHVVRYMAFYFVLVLPIFLVRRYLWEKRQKQGSEPDEKGKDEQP